MTEKHTSRLIDPFQASCQKQLVKCWNTYRQANDIDLFQIRWIEYRTLHRLKPLDTVLIIDGWNVVLSDKIFIVTEQLIV